MLSRWITPLVGIVAGAALFVTGCTQPDTSDTPEPPEKPYPPASEGAAQPTAMPIVVDELYVDAEAEPDEGTPPLIVLFTSIVEDHTGDYTCEWDFGDGSPKSSDLNPKHTYEKEGDFIVILNCTDSKGVKGETEIDVTVYEYE